jgi:hypothetical protein
MGKKLSAFHGGHQRGTRHGRKVRAFGEMVALMWARGECGATVMLEHLLLLQHLRRRSTRKFE